MIRRSSTPPSIGGRNEHPSQPSLLLMQAVLEDGIRTFLHNSPAPTRHAQHRWQEEFHWLTARDRNHPFTFERICEALAINASGLRARVLAAGARLAAPAVPQSLTAPRGTIPYRCSIR